MTTTTLEEFSEIPPIVTNKPQCLEIKIIFTPFFSGLYVGFKLDTMVTSGELIGSLDFITQDGSHHITYYNDYIRYITNKGKTGRHAYGFGYIMGKTIGKFFY